MDNLKLKNIDNIINNKKIENKNERNYGIDLLRIFSMIQVLILHLIDYSVGNKIKPTIKKYNSTYCLESMCTCCVNSFALISGVVGYKSYKFRNLIYLWFHIFFYLFILQISYSKINNIALSNIKIINIFPILINRQWYFNSYFIMYLFVPFLNEGIKNLNKKTFRNIIIFYLFFFSLYDIVSILNKTQPFNQLNSGYSALWLIILYIIGSYFGKYIINKSVNENNIFYSFKWILIFLFSTIFNYKLHLILINKKNKDFRLTIFKKYTNPVVLFQSISLLLFFSKLKIKSIFFKKMISFFTPLVFGVLLFHTYIFRFNIKILVNFFNELKQMNDNYYFYSIIFYAFFFMRTSDKIINI